VSSLPWGSGTPCSSLVDNSAAFRDVRPHFRPACPSAISGAQQSRERCMSEQRLMQGFPPAPERQVTLASWRHAPFTRSGLGHVRESLPSARIARSSTPPLPPRRSERALGGLAFQGPDGKERTIDGFLGETFTDGFLVMQRGRILLEWYDGALGQETPHIIF